MTLIATQNGSPGRLVKLAKENNKVLSCLTASWIKEKEYNPFPDLFFWVRADNLLTFGWATVFSSFVFTVCLLIGSMPNSLVFDLVGLVIASIGSTLLFTGTNMRKRVSNEEKLAEFTDAIGLLDWIYWTDGGVGRVNRIEDMWNEKSFLAVAPLCVVYLRDLATSKRELESIPWRQKEEQELSKIFDKHFDLITALTSLPRNREHYFDFDAKEKAESAVHTA